MKVLAVNGSARKDGNTALLIRTVFEELNKEGIETEMIQLSGKVIESCKACWACGGKRNCVAVGLPKTMKAINITDSAGKYTQ